MKQLVEIEELNQNMIYWNPQIKKYYYLGKEYDSLPLVFKYNK